MSNNILEDFNNAEIARLSSDRNFPEFRSGYSVSVEFYVQGTSGRTQIFNGLCIARRRKGLHSSFTLRRLSVNDIYVERTFRVHCPNIKEIQIHKKGKVRRAKLYYMRKLTGKAARISEERVNSSHGARA